MADRGDVRLATGMLMRLLPKYISAAINPAYLARENSDYKKTICPKTDSPNSHM